MTDELDLDPLRTAIVVIDLQNGIVARETVPHASSTVVANTARLLEVARRAGSQPVLVRVGGAPNGADRLNPPADRPVRAPTNPPPHATELVQELGHRDNDVVVFKRQWGAFYGTDLELQLRRRGLNTLVICGIATEFGVESTARDAYERGFAQVLVADAMSGLIQASHDNALENIFPRFGQIRATDTVIDALKASVPGL